MTHPTSRSGTLDRRNTNTGRVGIEGRLAGPSDVTLEQVPALVSNDT